MSQPEFPYPVYPEPKQNIANECAEIVEGLADQSFELRELARAFRMTGNHSVASQMRALAENIDELSRRTNEMVGLEINHGVAVAQHGTATILTGILRGAFRSLPEAKEEVPGPARRICE